MLVPQNNNRAKFDRGPCRISQERFAWLNERKYQTDLTRLEIADYVSYQFYHSFGYNLNIISPQTFNEKLQWLKVFYHNPIMHVCADKAQIKN
ncbi:MAG: hypothetical protein J5960_01285, partial [Desulfovibrio sp.]|nr:hypothetical protein [Desulfovibrio sp.]